MRDIDFQLEIINDKLKLANNKLILQNGPGYWSLMMYNSKTTGMSNIAQQIKGLKQVRLILTAMNNILEYIKDTEE